MLSDDIQERVIGQLGYIPVSKWKLNGIGKEMSLNNSLNTKFTNLT